MMNEADMIKRAKENWKCWQGLKETEPELAAWMDEHKADLVHHNTSGGWVNERSECYSALCNFLTYRLRADYQPPVKKWWFHQRNLKAWQSDIDEGALDMFTIEISESFARYVQNKPDGNCELLEVEIGDMYYDSACLEWRKCINPLSKKDGMTPHRWCRPRKVAGWVVYDVECDGVEDMILSNGVRVTPLAYAISKPGKFGRFGGVQFEGQNGDCWITSGPHLINGGKIQDHSNSDDARPAVPVRCRFWEGGAK